MMEHTTNDQLHLLLSHTEELCDRAARGIFCHTNFLSPREQHYVNALLRRRGDDRRARWHGGYAAAERGCLLLFPDYVADAFEPEDFAACPIRELLDFAGEDDPVAALAFQASGYCTLTHRDYLGSLLALGLEREVLGDIAVDNNHATVLCLSRMAPFLLSSVERIGKDAVRIRPTVLSPDFDGGRRFVAISDTVASPRLDCVVAALANLSREAAQTAVRDGLVELDYECELRPDRSLEAPCTISVRGTGKFILRELGSLTRKGRIRIRAERYV